MLKQMKYCTRATQKKMPVTLYVSIDNKQHRATAVTVAESEDSMKYCHYDYEDEEHDCLDYMECEECPYYYADLD